MIWVTNTTCKQIIRTTNASQWKSVTGRRGGNVSATLWQLSSVMHKSRYVNSKHPARQLKNAGAAIKREKPGNDDQPTQNECILHTPQTEFLRRLGSLSASQHGSTTFHTQAFPAFPPLTIKSSKHLPEIRTRDYYTTINSTRQHGKSHTLCADDWVQVGRNRCQTHPEGMLWHR